jgi:DNA-directed RNA polymerase subunit N (RpoN/RPB10)
MTDARCIVCGENIALSTDSYFKLWNGKEFRYFHAPCYRNMAVDRIVRKAREVIADDWSKYSYSVEKNARIQVDSVIDIELRGGLLEAYEGVRRI